MSGWAGVLRAAAVAAALVVVGPASGASADVSGPAIVSFLNAQRAAHGIPAGIVEDPTLSDGCVKHNNYGRLNNVLQHFENPDDPGYTPEGDQAARTSVLYVGGPWTSTSNPFETAPIHLHQLLAPRIDRMGASENSRYGCATTLASRNRPAPASDIAYTYPEAGATAWPASQTADELPYTPGQKVGIPAGTETGPYLYVLFDGPDLTVFDSATATSATLTGPDGPVSIAVVDNHTPGLEGLLPTGMELIPRAPLRPHASYTASVHATVTTRSGSGPARAFSRTWSFATGGLENRVFIPQYTISGRTLGITVQSRAPGGTVEATGPGAPASAPVGGDGVATFTVDSDGVWHVCARTGGDGTDYQAASFCVDVPVGDVPPPDQGDGGSGSGGDTGGSGGTTGGTTGGSGGATGGTDGSGGTTGGTGTPPGGGGGGSTTPATDSTTPAPSGGTPAPGPTPPAATDVPGPALGPAGPGSLGAVVQPPQRTSGPVARLGKPRVRGTGLDVNLACVARCTIRARGTVTRGRRRVRIRPLTKILPAAGKTTLRLRASRAAARRLGRGRRVIRIVVVATTSTGTMTFTHRVTLG